MNISQWPMSRIMQLPDECFGQRWLIFLEYMSAGPFHHFLMSEVALPDRCVVWGFGYDFMNSAPTSSNIRLALGDSLPNTAEEMDILDPLIQGLGFLGPEPRAIILHTFQSNMWWPMRKLILPQGRRLVMEFDAPLIGDHRMRLAIEVSSVPTEVPDWLHLG